MLKSEGMVYSVSGFGGMEYHQLHAYNAIKCKSASSSLNHLLCICNSTGL